MNKVRFNKTGVIPVSCIAILLFVLSIPMTSHGDDVCEYEIDVRVAANIININSQGEGHAVVVHTLQDYTIVDREETQVFVSDGGDDECPIASFGQREDDNGHLDIYFPLVVLQECEGWLEIGSEFNILRIEGVDDEECSFWGEAYMHIVGKQGPGKP